MGLVSLNLFIFFPLGLNIDHDLFNPPPLSMIDRIWSTDNTNESCRTKQWYGFTKAGLKWLDDRGYKWEKVCAEPGDLIVWDSRTPHYNLTPTGQMPRFCAYTCYLPVAEATQEELLRKKAAFESE